MPPIDGHFGQGAPPCAPPDNRIRAPRTMLPAQSCDSHAHICGPAATFPYAPNRIYTPPDALVPAYASLLKALGAARAVLVQPSVYGTDNRALLAALPALRNCGIACRAVAAVDPAIGLDELSRLDAAGVCGIRFNLVDVGRPQDRPPIAAIRALSARVAPFGWHTELLMHVSDDQAFDRTFADWPTPLVVGHMGYVRPGETTSAPGFQAMLRLAEAGQLWIKLTGPYRIAAGDLPYHDAGPFAQALVDRVPDQLVWGTDWPHVMVTKQMPNDADLVDLLDSWAPDPATRQAILESNPARLYGFHTDPPEAETQ